MKPGVRLSVESGTCGPVRSLNTILSALSGGHWDAGTALTIALFTTLALPTTLLLARLVPLGEVPDELAHVARAASLLRFEVIAERREGDAGVWIDPSIVRADETFLPGEPKKITATHVRALESVRWTHLAYEGIPNTAIYFPIFYTPAALGLGIANLLGRAPYGAVLMARYVNALCYTAVGIFSLILIQRGRGFLFAMLCLPHSLFLAGSCNPDGILLACALLATSLLTRVQAAYGRPYWAAGLLLACIIAFKVPYFPLALLMLIPAVSTAKEQVRIFRSPAIKACALVLLPALIWTIFIATFIAVPFLRQPYHPGPLWPGDSNVIFHSTDTAAQMKVFIHRPWLLVGMPLREIQITWPQTDFRNSVIGFLGLLNVRLPSFMYIEWWTALVFALLGATIGSSGQIAQARVRRIGIGMVAMVASVFSIYLTEYLTWTPVGAERIEGMYGRYLLPLLACVPAFLPSFQVSRSGALQWIFTTPAILIATIDVVTLPALVVKAYYLTL